MVFSSIIFILFFLPLFLISYYLSPKKIRNYVLLAYSLVFYAWGAPEFIFFLLGSVFANFYIVKEMYYARNRRNRKILAGLSVAINLGLLIYFKYSNFFVENSGTSGIIWVNII